MSRKNVVESFKIIDAGDLSSSFTSTNITNVLRQDKASIMIDWTGTAPVGEIQVEARNGPNEDFFQLDMGGTISISGASGNHRLVFNELPFTDIQLKYVRTSGTGSLDAVITMKTVGA